MKTKVDRYKNHVIVGAGSFGTTMAKVLADAAKARGDKRAITIVSRRKDQAEEINDRHTNVKYLPGITLPATVKASCDIRKSVLHADVIWLALPAQTLRKNLRHWGQDIKKNTIIVSLIKGMDGVGQQRMTQVIQHELKRSAEKIAALSGPNLALEIAMEQPAASVVACQDNKTAQILSELATSAYFKVDPSDDVVGVEMGGIVKNVIALAIGMCAGKNWGDNTKSSIMTRGFAEMVTFCEALGGKPQTMLGLAGFGDLVATCSSPLSRNYRAGRLLAEGKAAQDLYGVMNQTAEGITSVSVIVEAARRKNIVMPIAEVVYDIVRGKARVDQLGERLRVEAPIVRRKPRLVKKITGAASNGIFRLKLIFKGGILKR